MKHLHRPTRFFTDYEDQSEDTENESVDELVIPEDLTELSNEDLTALYDRAVDAFGLLYDEDGSKVSSEDIETLKELTTGIETLNQEIASRDEAAAERTSEATELAGRVGFSNKAEEVEDEAEEDVTESDEADVDTEDEAEEAQPETIAASGTRVNLSGLRSRQGNRQAKVPETKKTKSMKDVVFAAAEFGGFTAGDGMDFNDMANGVNRRLSSYNQQAYANAAASGRRLRQQYGIAVINKPFGEGMTINSDGPEHVDEVISRAVDEHRLPGKSLVASGGWCAPSETLYDLYEIESRDGLVSLPEVGITRGGVRFTPGPDFSTIMDNTDDFFYTEQEDIDGDYDGEGGGAKPCFKVDCPDFTEVRLDVAGLCISAGLLQQRGYPEMIARTIRGSLIAHDRKMSAKVIAGLVAGSDAITMTAAQVGTTAPLLTSIELQAEHTRYLHKMARGATLEAIMPYWVRGAVRADLSRRLGVDLINVPDSRIDAWFSQLNISVQYVYDWQDIGATAKASFTGFPATLQFLMYPAGTWVRGSSDIITLDTLYDSTLLGTNDYTALFSEEGWLLLKKGHDSRVITVPVCPTGLTGGGVDIACDGTAVPAA